MYRSKISGEVKVKIVESILDGKETQGKAAEILGINKASIQEWIRLYQCFGTAGLVPQSTAQLLTKEQKRKAVEAYLRGTGSLADICKRYGIRAKSSLQKWVREYNHHIEFREPGTHGSHRSEVYMRSGRSTTQKERIEMVSYCLDHNTDYAAVIEKYGVSYSQIYSWVRKFQESGIAGLEDRRGKKRLVPEMSEAEQLREENRLLKKQNKRLELENIVLKKRRELERGRR